MRKQRKTYACFIDIKKVYDTVLRDGLWAARWQRGKMRRVIRAYYGHIQSRAHVNGEVSECFDTETGVRQECVLSTILFDGLVRELKELGLGLRVDTAEALQTMVGTGGGDISLTSR